MRVIQIILSFLGRLCLSMIFILSGLNKILDWPNTERGLFTLLSDWQVNVSNFPFFQHLFDVLLPWVPVILVVTTIIELFGGLLLLIGIKVRLAAFLLLLFFIPATILLHQFWFLDEVRRELQLIMFLKNMAIVGGLLLVLAFGATVKKKESAPPHA